MNCGSCSTIPPIRKEGTLWIRPVDGSIRHKLQQIGHVVLLDNHVMGCSYSNWDELLQLFLLLEAEESALEGKLKPRSEELAAHLLPDDWVDLAMLQARLEHYDTVQLILRREFSSHMQPIVDQDLQVIGYEFLLRQSPGKLAISPYQLFEVARSTGLYTYLDRAACVKAIETSARYLPQGTKRFVNFLPSSIRNPKFCLQHSFDTIAKLSLDPADFVFEVVETEEIKDLDALKRIFDEYRRHGVAVALDDLGAGYATIELMNRLEPDYVKIDRSLIQDCHRDLQKQRQIERIVQSAKAFDGKVLAEGIENSEDYLYCLQAGIPLAQGYLFGRPQQEPLDYVSIA